MISSNLSARVDIFIRALFVQVCFSSAAIGVEFFMWIFGLFVYFETPKDRRRGRAIYLAISFAILVADCWARLPLAKYSFEVLYKPSNTEEILNIEGDLLDAWYSRASNWASQIILWLGNGLLVYRCRIVWIDKPIVTFVPFLLYLGGTAASVAIFAVNTTSLTNIPVANQLMTSSISLFISVNIIVTLLIAGRLINMRRRQAAIMTTFDSKMYIGVISILVESALPLSIIGILHLAASQMSTNVLLLKWRVVHFVFLILWQACVALAPQLIIFRVTIGRSWALESNMSSHLTVLAFQADTVDTFDTDRDVEGSIYNQRKDEPTSTGLQVNESASVISEKYELGGLSTEI
ncbi:hypothetical protein CPB83DRAFT_919728, partial [Crepidotus variabilis]